VLLLLLAPAHGVEPADLSLAGTVSDATPVVGSRVTFTIRVSNAGPGAAQRIKVSDRLPDGYVFVSGAVSRGSYDPASGEWKDFAVAAHGTAQLTLVATVAAGGNHANVAEIVGSSSPDPDSTPNNRNPSEDDYARVTAVPRRPNIIVIMADDLDTRSLDDLLQAGLMPNLQREIIDHAVGFDRSFVTTPLCCPSRASFLTGDYAHNTKIMNNRLPIPGEDGLYPAVGMFDDTDTLATRLQALGYTTALVGKYLNGYGSDAALAELSPAYDPHYVPPGWTTWRALIDFSTYCVYNYHMSADGAVRHYERPPGQSGDTATYQTNVLADLSESFVLAHRNDAAPFFLWVTPIVPHTEECADAYGGDHVPPYFKPYIRPAPEFENAVVPEFVPTPSFDEDVSDKPAWLQHDPLTAEDVADVTRQYQMRLRALLSLDVMVGRIVAALGDAREDTVLVFLSDNGWFLGEHRRTEKVLPYDEAARVPLYVALPWAEAGTRPNTVLNNDMAPTLLDIASPGYDDAEFDGRSFAALLTSPAPPGWVERTQFLMEFGRSTTERGEAQTYLALRRPATLYIETYAGTYDQSGTSTFSGLELYDLVSDPWQMESLIRFPQDAPNALLGSWLGRLHGCVAATCKRYENGVPPP
jgi:uncharacterized repeat protein (TIGR01451 family)